MKLQKAKPSDKTNNRKMVHIHADTHLKLQQLALYTGKPINELVDMLLVDALSRVELVESDDEINKRCTNSIIETAKILECEKKSS